MPATYEPISTQTLSSVQSTITFSSIPATYTDLVLVSSTRSQSSGSGDDNIGYRFNGDTATNYSRTTMTGDGTSASSFRGTNDNALYIALQNLSTAPANTFSPNILQVFNYANTTTFKTSLSRVSLSGSATRACVGLWRKTPEAITTISVFSLAVANFSVGSTFTLYGIKAA